MAIISAIREYIAGCPLLHDGAILGVDQLEADTIGYTVDTTPCEPVVQKYTDGSDKRQFLFVFASREKYGEKVLENIARSHSGSGSMAIRMALQNAITLMAAAICFQIPRPRMDM